MAFAKTDSFPAHDQQLARMASALAHPARLAILKLMADRKRRLAGEITAALPPSLARTTLSQHLTALRKCGLLETEVQGLTISYWLRRETVVTTLRHLALFCGELVPCPVCRQNVVCDCFTDGRPS